MISFGDYGRNLVISLWLGDKATINGVAAKRLTNSQKNPSAKIRWKSSRLDFLGSRRHPPSLIIFQRAKLSTRSITHICWCNWRTFEGSSPRGSCSCTTMPRFTGHLQPKLAYLGFQCLGHPPYSPDLIPSDYHLFPRPKKTIERSPFFVRRWGLAAAETWLDGQHAEFFWVACKSQSNELRSVLSFVGSFLNKSRVWSL